MSGRDYRASDADREAAAERLRIASIEGRIDSEELEQRLAEAYGARTVAELDRVVLDVLPPPPPPAPAYSPAPYQQPLPSTNGLAVASLVAGILWLGWLGSFLAVVFGHIALNQIKQSNGREGGSGLAITGLVFGYFGVLTFVLVVLAGAAFS